MNKFLTKELVNKAAELLQGIAKHEVIVMEAANYPNGIFPNWDEDYDEYEDEAGECWFVGSKPKDDSPKNFFGGVVSEYKSRIEIVHSGGEHIRFKATGLTAEILAKKFSQFFSLKKGLNND